MKVVRDGLLVVSGIVLGLIVATWLPDDSAKSALREVRAEINRLQSAPPR